MKIKTRILVVTLAALAMSATQGEACTNFIVGKKASVDGSVICSYNADDYGMFIGLAHYAAGTHKKGEMRDIVDWDTHKYIGKIPEAPVTYNVIGNINEFQVTIGETTYGGREEMVNPDGGIDYGSLIYLGLQRSRTAREAIKVMTTLAQTYGYCSEGETFTICDPNEAWIMEMQGKGKGEKGVVWVAQRIPDDAICGHANQSRIGKFNMKDKNNVMYAKDVVAFARKKGWFKGKDADFNWKMTYAKPDFSGRRICDARVWQFFNRILYNRGSIERDPRDSLTLSQKFNRLFCRLNSSRRINARSEYKAYRISIQLLILSARRCDQCAKSYVLTLSDQTERFLRIDPALILQLHAGQGKGT